MTGTTAGRMLDGAALRPDTTLSGPGLLDVTTDIDQPPESLRDKRRLVPAGTALLIALVALTTGLLLNARSLQQTAENQPLGSPVRTITVALIRPVAAISTFLKLDTPHDTIDQALGRTSTTPPEEPVEPAAPVVVGPAVTESTTTTAAPSVAATTGSGRTISQEAPLRVYLFGDSLGKWIGPALINLDEDQGVLDVEHETRHTTGLTRPDYFNWPANAQSRIAELDPELAIVMFGGNDGQEIYVDGEIQAIGSPLWIEVYTERVAEMMDVIVASGVEEAYWIGLPITESPTLVDRYLMMNEIYRSEAGKRPAITYVDIWDLFKDENGNYARYLKDENGDLVEFRLADNIHYHWAGAERLAGTILDRIRQKWPAASP